MRADATIECAGDSCFLEWTGTRQGVGALFTLTGSNIVAAGVADSWRPIRSDSRRVTALSDSHNILPV